MSYTIPHSRKSIHLSFPPFFPFPSSSILLYTSLYFLTQAVLQSFTSVNGVSSICFIHELWRSTPAPVGSLQEERFIARAVSLCTRSMELSTSSTVKACACLQRSALWHYILNRCVDIPICTYVGICICIYIRTHKYAYCMCEQYAYPSSNSIFFLN